MGSGLYSLLMLALVLAAIPATLWAMKRLQNLQGLQKMRTGAAPPPLQVVSQLSLGPRERVVVLRMAHRELVLGVTAQQVTLLAEQPLSPLPAKTPQRQPASRAGTMAASSMACQACCRNSRCCGSINCASRAVMLKNAASKRSMSSMAPIHLL